MAPSNQLKTFMITLWMSMIDVRNLNFMDIHNDKEIHI